MSALKVAVVQGGPSVEAEVSRNSAKSVSAALEEAGHHVVRLELDARLAEALRTGGFDVVFPVVHGAVGEDGGLQGLLEVLDLPYVGSGVLASAAAMNKRFARRVFGLEGLPIAKGTAFPRGDATAFAERARFEVGARLVIKPACSGSAIGVTRIEAHEPIEAVASALTAAWAIDGFAIVEHFAKGREVTCGVLDLGAPQGPRALPPTEIVSPKDAFYTYEARYAPGRSVHTCPANLPADVLARVQEVAVLAHQALECRDLSRADFVVGDEGDPFAITLLEVNTLPGFTATSLFPEAAAVSGVPMRTLCDALVLQAKARGATARLAAMAFPK